MCFTDTISSVKRKLLAVLVYIIFNRVYPEYAFYVAMVFIVYSDILGINWTLPNFGYNIQQTPQQSTQSNPTKQSQPKSNKNLSGSSDKKKV